MKVPMLVVACASMMLAVVPADQTIDAAPTTAPASAAPSATYTHLVDLYLHGPWDLLVAELSNASTKDLPAAEQADLAYIKQSVAESRPPWWDKAKAREKVAVSASVWGRRLNATFDPDGKSAVQMARMPSGPVVTLTWPADDMDKAALAEHGFTKGELCGLSVWSTIGFADAWAVLPEKYVTSQTTDADRLMLSRYMDFRGTAAGMYYAPPRSRQWGLFLCLANYQEKYAKSPTVMPRRSIGAVFMHDVLDHRDKYPSVKLPAKLDADDAEAKLANAVRGWIEKHDLTLAEDRTLRDTLKSFALNNDKPARETGKVTLPNKLMLNFDIDADTADKQARDKYVKSAFDRITK